jgi:DNA-binding NarL/FixJ family response regulator
MIRTRVLIVDDHTTFTELLTGALDREPDLCSVGFANSVASGVEQCLALSPDVVVMDYHLPDGTGVAAARQILGRAPQTRIVMLTGDPSPEALQQGAAVGCFAVLAKDGSLAALLAVLRRTQDGRAVPAMMAGRSGAPADV